MGYSLSAYERATTVNFNEEEERAVVITASPVWMRKLDRLCEENPEQFSCEEWDTQRLDGKIVQKRYTFPKRFITIRSRDRKQELTEEQREAARDRMKQINNSRF